MDILYLLDQLEDLLKDSSKVPMTSRVLVDEQDVLDIIDQIRVSIPDEIKSASRITRERDQLLADAREEADRLVREADAHIADRLADHHLVRSAEVRAAQIEDRALQQADQVRRESEQYAYRVMQKLREQIAQISQTVDRGLQELESHPAREEVADRV
jgi:cell division septum initiation protein DivIVA